MRKSCYEYYIFSHYYDSSYTINLRDFAISFALTRNDEGKEVQKNAS